jgi:23S rRNA (cytidine1920-2'-O)/16S rRNA (cytidine1409-2'-O)-methyltransferase
VPTQLLVARSCIAAGAALIAAGRGHERAWRRSSRTATSCPSRRSSSWLDAAEARYVSRGGLKLEGALAVSGIDVAGWLCLDVGQSTGGFTDCLLQHGARRWWASTSATASCMRSCARTSAWWPSKASTRASSADDLQRRGGVDGAGRRGDFDLVTSGDLSFISLTLVLPAWSPLLADGGQLLMLVKPQFELQPGQVGKGGIVRDESLYAVVEKRLRDACAGARPAVLRLVRQPDRRRRRQPRVLHSCRAR